MGLRELGSTMGLKKHSLLLRDVSGPVLAEEILPCLIFGNSRIILATS